MAMAESSSGSGEFMEDFGQKVDLTQRIREVLVSYPEGTTILKELIQNADDAGAATVRFCLDRRRHPSASLLSASLAPFQGPSLLAFNDAAFSPSDFHSISRIGDSGKRDLSWKTGRFGIGFNSVYHLSDLPSFVSGTHAVFFDPQCKFLPGVSSLNPGKRVDFVKSSALKKFPDQFSPYRAFGCGMAAPFGGTLFRLPLRTVDQAATSRLSTQAFTADDVAGLLRELSVEAAEIMIFLKNLEVLEVYEWETGREEPSRVFSCSVKSGPEVRRSRLEFLRLAKKGGEEFNLTKHAESFRLDLVNKGGGGEESVSSFLVSQMMADSSSKIGALARNAFKSYGMRLLPWVAIAASLSGTGHVEGRAFCFLPLPLKTGLPVHVNGFFELSANRRDIWHGSDMDRMGRLRSEWNRGLLEEVAAPCLCQLLYEARKLGAGVSYYSMWPVGKFTEPWSRMVEQFYRGVFPVPLLYTATGKGSWLSPKEVFFHDEDYDKSEVLAEALLANGLPLTRLPQPVREMLLTYSSGSLKMVTPAAARIHLQKGCRFVQRSYVFTALDYCLSDLLDEEVGEHLRGLALVPLEDQTVGRFGTRHEEVKYFKCSSTAEHVLLEKVAGKLVDQKLPDFLTGRMNIIAKLAVSNIRLVDDSTLSELLQFLLPPEWENCDEVRWKPGVETRHPSREWLARFWDYLCAEQRSLSKLQKWPVLPTTTGNLRRPLGLSDLLRGGKVDKELEGVLLKAGCSFLDTEFNLQHPRLSDFARDPSSPEVLDALGFGAANDVTKLTSRFSSVSDSERREMRSFLYKICWAGRSEVKESRLRTFKSLPIFEAYDSLGAGSLIFVPIHDAMFLAPSGVDSELLGPDCLHSSNAQETQLLTHLLGVPELKKSDFYKRIVLQRLPSIPAPARDTSMLQILRELSQLSIEDSSFVDSLKRLSFVPTGAGELKPPGELYDPGNLELLNLLDDQQFFPSSQYSSPDVLESLRSLGLRTAVTPETVITSARSIEALLASDQIKATERGRVLLSYLDKNSSRWLPSSQETGINWLLSKASTYLQGEREAWLNKFWMELASICWCPVLMQPPNSQMPWPVVSQPLAPPRLVRLRSDMWLISATMRILDGNCDSPGVCQRFGWLSRLGGNILAAQLLELGKRDTDQLGKVLATTIPKIYSLLNDMVGTEEMELVKVILEDCSWIWVGSGFAKAKDVVFDGPLHLAPYLHVVPADLAAFRELFVELGVKESLDGSGYTKILSVMAKEKQGSPLDSRQLAAVVWIVQHLADMNYGAQARDIMVPDAGGTLTASSQLVYNDAPWLFASKDMQPGWLSESSRKVVYAKISNDVAEKVGVSSVRKSLLAESADFMDLGLHDAMEAFGQSESLTSRLKHIVDMYVDGPGILFELLQNADDAGASEVCFLLDESSFGTSSVLSRQMADWQGPALYCYNNAVFKPEDLHAISRIGQNSKLDKPAAIGRFGLGFNSVYHFTDVPGFVSGPNVVLLDPHAANLPGITPAQPGLKINFVGKDLVRQFPDQFEPFLLFGCDLQRPFRGTLFRFPLRTSKTAARSEIKHDSYDPEDVQNLFSALEGSPEVLLFLRNLTSIKVYSRRGVQSELVELFKLEKENVDYQERELQEFVLGTGAQRLNKEQFVKRLEKTTDKLLPASCGRIRLACSTADGKQVSSWLISSALGGGNAKQFALSPESRGRGFVPWAGIAAKLTESGPRFEGRAFCFLPLPVKAGLPVHVNGYFELSANRRDIWYDGDMVGKDKLRSEWNICLLRDAAAPAYARLLHRAALELGPGSGFQSLWPVDCAGEPWKLLLLDVYKAVVELELPVLYTAARGGKWISPKQAVFPDTSFSDMHELGEALVNAGLPLVAAPGKVIDKFREVYPSLRFFSPHLLRRLLITSRRTFPRSISILALKYCLTDVETEDEEAKLHGLSLVPMADSSFGTLNTKAAGAKIILADEDERRLLKYAFSDMLADIEVTDEVFPRLMSVARNGATNVFLMTPEILQELLPVVLPPDWNGREVVPWTPGVQGHPTVEWMERLWKYLAVHLGDLSSKYTSWPLLPTSDGKLLRFSEHGPLIVNAGWSENLTAVFQKSGCYLLRTEIPVKLREYAQEATAHGVLLAMFAAAGGNLRLLPDLLTSCTTFEVRELRQFLFQSRWFTSAGMDDVQLQVLRNLRLFERSGAGFRSLADCKQLIAPDGIDEVLLGGSFVPAESGKEEDILRSYFGLRKLSKDEYFRDYFVETIGQVSVHERMGAFVKAVKDFSLIHAAGLSSLSQLPFVPTSSGSIEAPVRLYDPRVAELQTLLNKQVYFPSEEFRKSELLDILVSVGLQQSLGQEGLLDSARSVALIADGDPEEASRKGKALLSHINSLGSESAAALEPRFWMDLSSISWCPVLQARPNPVLPWLPDQQTSVAPPKLVRPAEDTWLVSGAMRILDGDCCDLLSEELGWKQSPKASVLAQQLILLSNRYTEMQKSGKDLALLEETSSTISDQVKRIYSLLQGFLGCEEMLSLQTMLDGQSWLWIGDGFIQGKDVAMDAAAHFHPYLYVLPLELLEFKELLLLFGVREAFAAADYVSALQRLAGDVKGDRLKPEQLTFVLRLLEMLAEVLDTAGDYNAGMQEAILIPDAACFMVLAKGLVYNDAPWLTQDSSSVSGIFRLVHPEVDNDLARKLGARSLRYLSVVDQEMTSSLPCMAMDKIVETLPETDGGDYILFDLLEIADCCQARKVHFIYDNQEHPKQSLLQPNLSEFQGPALVMAFEGVSLTTEEICALHSSPPVKLHGQACRYGRGLFGAYRLTDLMLVVSSGCLYLFDPAGQVLAPALADGGRDPTGDPIGKAFSLQGTGLVERFTDQFQPFNIRPELSLHTRNVTFFRFPLRASSKSAQLDRIDVAEILNKFKLHATKCLLFLKSVEEVLVSERTSTELPREIFSVSLSSAFAALRHPFQEKKWRKFQLSNFFGSSNAASKTHTIDVFFREGSATTVLKWIVVQTLASGQTRDMALDRRYLHYQLTPIAGIAACISVDGSASVDCSKGGLLCPLPVGVDLKLPVTIFGNFLPFTSGTRHLFHEGLGDHPVKVGMLGSHTGPALSDDIVRATWNRQLLSCVCESYMDLLQEIQHSHLGQILSAGESGSGGSYSLWPRSDEEAPTEDARCLAKWLIKPMYARLVDMPVWQLHSGSMVKFNEGVFIAPSSGGVAPKASVSNLLKAHYRIFTVPWELGKEAEKATGLKLTELTPKTIRSLVKVPSVAAAVQSLEDQIDLLEYCCADALLEGSSENVEINKAVLTELKGVTCPTANEFMVKLGTLEVWVATREQQQLLPGQFKRFLHPSCLDRPLLATLFYNGQFQVQLNVKPFSSRILAENIRTVLPRDWSRAAAPWVDWDQKHPSDSWIRSFWDNVNVASVDELSLFDNQPLIPATNGRSAVLVRVAHRQAVFAPLLEAAEENYPWLVPVLSKLGVPVFHVDYTENCRALDCCRPQENQALVRTVLSKLVALEDAGVWNASAASSSFTPDECTELFNFLATLAEDGYEDESQAYDIREIRLLRSLPIFKTARGDHVGVDPALHFTVSPGAFLQPDDEHRLSHLPSAAGGKFYELLGIPELSNTDLLVRCVLPAYGILSSEDRDKVVAHIHQDWEALIQDSRVVSGLKNTKFVMHGSGSEQLCSPGELVDPENPLLKQIFAEERWRFPGRQFSTPRWLQILRTVGLRSIQDPGLILECAKKIEESGRQDLSSNTLAILGSSNSSSRHISDTVWSLAGLLAEEIVNNIAAVYSSSFCDALSRIQFVPAEKGIPAAAGGDACRCLTSYSEAALLKDWPLSWTCCPLLTRSGLVPPAFSWLALHLRSPPPVSVVIKHLQVVGQNGGEDVLARWPNTKGSRSVEDVFGEVLSYLSSIWNELSDSDKKELSSNAFIPVANGTRLVRASSLYTKLGMDLAPFVFEIPRAYLAHVKILSGLGMRYEPAAADMVALLSLLQQTCGYQPLNPNELQAVFSILRFICGIAAKGSFDPAGAVVVPDENARLVHASSCAYVDAAGARLVDKIDPGKVRYVHPSLPQALCTVIGVRKLSEIVLEELDESEPLHFLDSLGSHSLSFVQNQLSSPEFGEFVWTILGRGTKQEVLETLSAASQNLRFVQSIRTSFRLLPGLRDITRQGQRQALYYVNRSSGRILAAEPPGFISVPDLLALLVSQILESSPLCLPLAPLFNSSINREAGYLKQAVKLLAPGIDHTGRKQTTEAEKLLGKDVLSVDAKALQFCPLRPFYTGEIVGWQEKGGEGQAKYGRVVEDIRAPAGQPLYRIRVETSPGEVRLLSSSNVFSFKGTGSNTATTKTGVPALESQPTVPSETFQQQQQNTFQSDSEMNDSVLNASGYTQAISDILASLGLPLSLERQSLLEHTLSLQEQLNSTNTLLAAEQERADAAVLQEETMKASWSCRICLGSEVDSVLVPCGHVLCHRCSAALTRCPFCRQSITSRHTMYRP